MLLKVVRADKEFLREHAEKGNLFVGDRQSGHYVPAGPYRGNVFSYDSLPMDELQRLMKRGLVFWKHLR